MSKLKLILGLFAALVCAAPAVAQTAGAADGATAATPAPTETEAAMRRISRARALAAIGKLAAAAAELEALRATTSDESVRDVSRVLLMSILVEMPDYARAASLLDEAYAARASGGAGGAAAHAYFALAGQTVSAVRTHLERYRTFGLNVADAELPPEANGDLEQLRALLERVVEQAKAIGGERASDAGNRDATALLEDAATVRLRIARPHADDRARWQTEVSDARQRLFASETRIASLSDIPAARAAAARTTQPAPNANAAPAAAVPAGTSAPVSVGSLLSKARKRPEPSYPAVARAQRVSGVVTVFLLVNAKGDVDEVERAEGPALLQSAAAEAARRWKFNPTLVNGQPVPFRGYVSFNFKP